MQETLGDNENYLTKIGMKIFDAMKIHEDKKELKKQYKDIFNTIAQGYQDVKNTKKVFYHNILHAADVVQTVYTYLHLIQNHLKETFIGDENGKTLYEEKDENLPTFKLSNKELAAIFFAAAGHDYGHIGVENRCYQVLYPKYIGFADPHWTISSGIFSLERFHANQIILLLTEKGFFNGENGKYLKQLVKMCIERTDGNFNHEYILENLLIENEEGGLHSLYKNNKIDLIAYLVHLADISNPSKSYRIYYIWAKRVIAEFLRQGLVESKGREKNIFKEMINKKIYEDKYIVEKGLYARQYGFIVYFLQPIVYPTVNKIFPSLEYISQRTKYNLDLLNKYSKSSDKAHTLPSDKAIIDEYSLIENDEKYNVDDLVPYFKTTDLLNHS